MLRSYKYRLYPTKQQSELINKHFAACRFVYNIALETKNFAYNSHNKNLSSFDLINQLPELKKECIWLKEVQGLALQQSIINLGTAFNKFFKGYNRFPNFKKKKEIQSFRNPMGIEVKISKNKIHFPKFTEGVKFVQDRIFNGSIKNTTVSKTTTGKYFISVLVETGKETPSPNPIREKTALGIDLGIKHFIVTSDGLKTDNPKYLKSKIERLKILKRRLRNKKKGSNNTRKAYKKIALVHEKITNQRKDFLHKLSTQLIKSHDTLCMEDLKINNMVKNHNLAQSISDAGWGMFVEMCKYKAEWNGKNILKIPTFEPSTKLCSNCGATNNNLTLADREWTCKCGSTHDRDINAAINIKNYCIRNSGKVIPGAPVEMLAIVKSKKQEVNNLV